MSDKYYILSEDINVFPIGQNRNNNPEARLLNEKNLTNVFKNLTSKDKYVLKYEGNVIEFVIDGYFVRATLLDDDMRNDLYVKLMLYNEKIESDQKDTSSQISKFRGVEFYISDPNDPNAFQVLDSGEPVNTYRYEGHHVDMSTANLSFIKSIVCGNYETLMNS